MKKFGCLILVILCLFSCVACSKKNSKSAIELMGAGDRIHDTFTFANTGVEIINNNKNVYTISGSVEKLDDEKVKNEFSIESDISHVVAIKLSAMEDEVEKNEVQISVDGVRNYDAEHLNGSDYTFIILEVVKNKTVTITVKWNKNSEEKSYIIYFAENIELK